MDYVLESYLPTVKFYEFYSFDYFRTDLDPPILVDIDLLHNIAIHLAHQYLQGQEENNHGCDQDTRPTETGYQNGDDVF